MRIILDKSLNRTIHATLNGLIGQGVRVVDEQHRVHEGTLRAAHLGQVTIDLYTNGPPRPLSILTYPQIRTVKPL